MIIDDDVASEDYLATRVVSLGPKLDMSRRNMGIHAKVPQSTANLHQAINDDKEIVYIPPLSGKNSAGFSLLHQ